MVYIFKCLNNLQEPFHIILPTKFTKNYLPITLIITLVFKSSFTQHKIKHKNLISQFSSVTQSCPTLCDPMDHSMPGFPVHHQLPEFTQTHVHWVSDAIQPSHPLSSPSPSTINLSQYQGPFKWVTSSHQVAKLLEFQLYHQTFPMNIKEWFPLGLTGWISLQSKGLSRVFSNTTFKSINSSAFSFLYSPTLIPIHDHWKNHSLD